MKFQEDGFVLSLSVSSIDSGQLYSTRSLVHSPGSNPTLLHSQLAAKLVGTNTTALIPQLQHEFRIVQPYANKENSVWKFAQFVPNG